MSKQCQTKQARFGLTVNCLTGKYEEVTSITRSQNPPEFWKIIFGRYF